MLLISGAMAVQRKIIVYTWLYFSTITLRVAYTALVNGGEQCSWFMRKVLKKNVQYTCNCTKTLMLGDIAQQHCSISFFVYQCFLLRMISPKGTSSAKHSKIQMLGYLPNFGQVNLWVCQCKKTALPHYFLACCFVRALSWHFSMWWHLTLVYELTFKGFVGYRVKCFWFEFS